MSSSGGFGVQLQIEITAALTTIVDVLDVDFPEFEKVMAEMTGHDATGGYAEHVATGKRMLNSFSATLGWDVSEATHAEIITAFDSDDPVNMAVISPDAGETITFSAHVVRVLRIARQDDGYKCEVEIQPTGQPTIT